MARSSATAGSHWQWDTNENGITFASHNATSKAKITIHPSMADTGGFTGVFTGASSHGDVLVKFREGIDMLEQIRFRRQLQRHCKPTEPKIVTIQDIKDVVIFQSLSNLPKDFIDFFHTREIDRFLRTLIVYFQLYIQITDTLQDRQNESMKKLRYWATDKVEKTMREDLADVRSMVACEYSSLLLGTGNLAKFHHLATGYSSSAEKDIRQMEILIRCACRVTWIALQRRGMNLIELELNRLLRTNAFNVTLHTKHVPIITFQNSIAQHVLTGDLRQTASKFLSRSPLIHEMLENDHDLDLLSMGYLDLNTKYDRTELLQKACFLPEEQLIQNGINVGILGLQRNLFDTMLFMSLRMAEEVELAEISYQSLKNDTSKDYPEPTTPVPTSFQLPPRAENMSLPNSFPRQHINVKDAEAKAREIARNKWKSYSPTD